MKNTLWGGGHHISLYTAFYLSNYLTDFDEICLQLAGKFKFGSSWSGIFCTSHVTQLEN
jgi:hypothetical protein